MTTPLITSGSEGCASFVLERTSEGQASRYRHFMWFANGAVLSAELVDVFAGARPTFHGLIAHLEKYPEKWGQVVRADASQP